MGKNKQKQNPVYKLALQAILLAWGIIPGAKASVNGLKQAIRVELLKMGVMDPEIPDNLLAILAPSLARRGVTQVAASELLAAVDTSVAANVAAEMRNDSVYLPDGSLITSTSDRAAAEAAVKESLRVLNEVSQIPLRMLWSSTEDVEEQSDAPPGLIEGTLSFLNSNWAGILGGLASIAWILLI